MEVSETKRYTFISLFENQLPSEDGNKLALDKVKVPKIQRPYAQGRVLPTETYIRKNFLTDIFNSLVGNKKLELNFIYGSITPEGKYNVLELLDGQQRLTTLFLLYWYMATRELERDSDEDLRCRKCLENFYYETRTTSSDFCQHLSTFYCDLTVQKPSDAIKGDIRWFFQIFNQDSTIVSMLKMLDDIHERYNQLPESDRNLYSRLENISFYVLPLQKFRLTEELYIKMNARGLQLSPFDNFKAGLTGFVSEKGNSRFAELRPLPSNRGKGEIPFYLDFSSKLDTTWIDLFWRKPNEEEDLFEKGKAATNAYEQAYLSFFNRFFAYKYMLGLEDINLENLNKDKRLKFFYIDSDDALVKGLNTSFEPFNDLLREQPEMVFDVEKELDVFLDNFDKIQQTLTPAWDSKPYAVYTMLERYTKFQHSDFIILSAILSYIIQHNSFDSNRFEQWMRVVHNIVENTNIDGVVPTARLVILLNQVASRVAAYESFYEGLSNYKDENDPNKIIRALEEEIAKAELIKSDESWLDAFKIAEKDVFWKGYVGLMMADNINPDEFLRRYSLMQKMFDKDGITPNYGKDGEHILIRGILSQIDDSNKLNKLYVTERVEAQKHLKNLLSERRFAQIQEFFKKDLLSCSTEDEIKSKLVEVVKKDYDLTNQSWPKFSAAISEGFNRLLHEPKLFDLAQTFETSTKVFRIYYDYDNAFYACPNARNDGRIMLDTERNVIIPKLVEEESFEYENPATGESYKKYGESFGFGINVKKVIGDITVWVCFDAHAIVHIYGYNLPREKYDMVCSTFADASVWQEDSLNANFFGETIKYKEATCYQQILDKINDVIRFIS